MKSQTSIKNRKDKRVRGDYWGNKLDLIVREISGFEISIYYGITYWYW